MKKKTRILSYLILSFSLVSCMVTQAQDNTQQGVLHLDLKTCIKIAHDNNPTLKIANLEIQRVDYAKKEAIGSLLPNVSATGQYTNNIMKSVMFMPASMRTMMNGASYMEIGYKNSYTGTVSASLPIINFSLWENIKAKQGQIDLILEQSRSSNIDMSKSVKDAYYSILLAKASLKVINQSIDNANEVLKTTKTGFEHGTTSEYDYLKAQVQVNSLTPNLISAKSGVELAELQLKMLLSLPENQAIEITETLEDYQEDISLLEDYSSQKAYTNNSELRQLDLQISNMQHTLKMTKYQHIPTLSGFGQYVYQTQAEDFKFNDYNWVSSAAIGLQLNIPIFSGNTIINQTKQTEIALRELQLQRDYLSDGTNLQVTSALSNMRTAKEKLLVNKETITQAQKGYDIAKVRYASGSGTILELNDSELQLTQAHLNYQQSIYDYLSAKADYEKAIGME